ncbi:SDR family oxidoreductase [Pseudomonas oryzae]|uniref:Short-chain dehydrogenase n=1 Tax=Pseudomonas oryzae TaxID=1392877 RepID=A0A1H1PHI6_9PSED|nr:SDR family oxidoreductase [Pseudomonas oryzae]SDS10119.1 Short-chain dehydrogenase [Pseudomonas oryzae]
MKPFVLITGASSGIGLDCARLLVEQGYRVIGTVRREEDGLRLRDMLGADFTPLLLDVTHAGSLGGAVRRVEALVGADGLAALVNNAGIASPNGPLLLQPLEEIRGMFEVNLFGLLAVIQAFAPLLGARKGSARPGRLINISSVSGRVATPLTGAYAASKHALEAFNDTLRIELGIYGIEVVAIEPGPIRTPIWGKAKPDPRYAGTDYEPAIHALLDLAAQNARKGAQVERVSQAVLHGLRTPRPKPRYPLHPMWRLAALLPTRWIDRILARKMALPRR